MSMELKNKIEDMLSLQEKINSQINPNWRENNNLWYRAIWTECAEFVDHIGWKWWKKQVLNLDQAQIELVDIWHFGLSDLLQWNIDIDKIINIIDQSYFDAVNQVTLDKSDLLAQSEVFLENTIISKRFDVKSFIVLLQKSQLDIDKLYKLYIAKNILNSFRQNNGYKTGEYIKIWNGKEDNEYLHEILNNLVENKENNLVERLYSELDSIYKLLDK